MAHVLRDSGQDHEIQDFSPWGYDERQYCSPGFDLPVGCLMRTPHGRFPEYHTSADNLELVRPEALADSFAKCLRLFEVLEQNRTYLNTNPNCEPQLGKRGLYDAIGGRADRERGAAGDALGPESVRRHATTCSRSRTKSSMPFEPIARVAAMLREHGLLVEAPS